MVQAGDIIGSYELLDELGVGGGGAVFRARHVLLGREVAVKVMNEDFVHDQQLISRFFHEARIVNAIRHPNIIDIVDFLDLYEPRRVAYVMELLQGRSLTKAATEGGLTARQAANACLQIASVLEAAHDKQVIHRDLKPDNVFVIAPMSEDWSRVPSIKVLDFGVAKVSSPDVAHKTETGVAVGTPVYMAPEQLVAAPVSGATDVYALGEILYEVLTGRRMFQGPHTEILRQKISATPAGDFNFPQLADPRPVAALIRQCIALQPEERPSLRQLMEVLEKVARGETPAYRYDPPPPAITREAPAASGDASDVISLLPPYAQIEAPLELAVSPPITRAAPPPPRPRPPSASRPRASVERPLVAQGVVADEELEPPARSRGLLYLLSGLTVVGLGAIAALLLRGPGPSSAPLEPSARPAHVASASPIPSAKPDPVVQVMSDPPGASVIDEASGAEIGRTPLRVVLVGGAARAVRISLPGHLSRSMQLEGDVNVVLAKGEDPQRRPKPSASSSPSVGSPTPAASPSASPTAPAATPSPKPQPSEAKPLRKDETTEW